ncbi:MAG: hypothetical protein WBJ62_01695 [Coriobacteriia bacterium]
MRTRPFVSIVLFALVLVLGLSGCDAAQPEDAAETETGAEPGTNTEVVADPAGDDDGFEYLEGSWDLATALTDIDNAMMTAAAGQPGAVWESVIIEGDTIAFTSYNSADQAVKHDYAGTIEAENGGWLVNASATYTDETGAIWTSTIEVHGNPTGDDSFGGYMVGSIDSDTDGHLYRATWDITGMRQ